MSDLKASIAKLADDFAQQVLAAVRGASIAELGALDARTTAEGTARPSSQTASEPKGAKQSGSRLPRARKGARRTAADFESISDAIVGLLGKHEDGLRSEEIQRALALSRKDLPRPLAHALAAKLLRKTGMKRATRYFAR